MFPRSRVDLFYRILCFLAFLTVIVFSESLITLIVIMIAFYILTIPDKRIEDIYLYIVTAVVLIICIAVREYTLLRISVILDYIFYFFSVIPYTIAIEEEKVIRNQDYIRFKKIKKVKKKESNNMLCTIFVTIHMMLLLLAIMVG